MKFRCLDARLLFLYVYVSIYSTRYIHVQVFHVLLFTRTQIMYIS